MAADPEDAAAPEPPSDGISCLAWSPVQDMLAASSWDQSVRLWEVSGQSGSAAQLQPRLTLPHEAPVLSCCFTKDGQRLVSGACDGKVRLKDLATQQEPQAWQHDGPVKAVFSMDEANLVVSGSWDKTVRFWSPQQPTAVATIKLPERVYAMDMKYPLMVVGCADRHLLVYDLTNIQANQNPLKQGFSSLKMQTRSISCFADGQGYAVGSIEGRCSIVHLTDNAQTFTFRCHRSTEEYSSVNAIDFHPSHGTFATAGCDGSYVFWDRENRHRLNQFNTGTTPISAAKFSAQGDRFAYAVSYDWSRGHEANSMNLPNQVMVHQVARKDVEARPKSGAKK